MHPIMITGGTDIITVTIVWNIMVMCHFPNVQKKVSAKIDSFVGLNGRLPHFSERN